MTVLSPGVLPCANFVYNKTDIELNWFEIKLQKENCVATKVNGTRTTPG